VDDILSLIMFNVLFSLGSAELTFMGTFFRPLMGVLFMAVTVWLAMEKLPSAVEMVLERYCEGRDGRNHDKGLFFIMVVVLIAYAEITHHCGTHLWGCFIAGMSFAVMPHAHTVWVKQTKRYTTWMIRIFFSATVAFAIPIDELGNPDNIWKGAIMGIGPCILTKVCCAFFMGEPKWVIGWAMVGRAEFAYLIAQMASSANMMEPATFSIVIWSLLWATVWAPFIFRIVLHRYSVKLSGEQEESGSGENVARRPVMKRSASLGAMVMKEEDPQKAILRNIQNESEAKDSEINGLMDHLARLEVELAETKCSMAESPFQEAHYVRV